MVSVRREVVSIYMLSLRVFPLLSFLPSRRMQTVHIFSPPCSLISRILFMPSLHSVHVLHCFASYLLSASCTGLFYRSFIRRRETIYSSTRLTTTTTSPIAF